MLAPTMLGSCILLVLAPAIALALPWEGRGNGLAPAIVVRHWEQLEGETVNMLDAMVQLMQGGGEFDRSFLSKLNTCMNSISPDLWAVSDGA